MSTLSDDTLRKILLQIQTQVRSLFLPLFFPIPSMCIYYSCANHSITIKNKQAITSQKQLAVVKAQITSKEKERRILALQVKELGNVPGDGRMYKGVGKMWVSVSITLLLLFVSLS